MFGGSFDPPHRGHAALLKAAMKALRPDRALVVPAGRNPLKPAQRSSPSDRLLMARAWLSSLKPPLRRIVELDPVELDRCRSTYTYELVRHMRRRFPGAELWFLSGTDIVASLDAWKRPAELIGGLRWAVGRRPGTAWRPLRGMRCLLLPGVFPDISATAIRARVLAGLDCSAILLPAVLDVVRRRSLYGLSLRQELEGRLPGDRYRHTLAVAALAVELAFLHGEDPERAALAGLLHDCGRMFDLPAQARYARRRGLRIPARRQIERNAPILLHSYVSADLARRRFGVRDAGVRNAIARHTLGAPRMSSLDKLLYVADLGAADRAFPAARRVRRLARRDLGRALREAVAAKIHFLTRTGAWLHPMTATLWNAVRK